MDKQAQDARWDRLSEREQAGWLENYKCNKEDGNKESMKIIEELFGEHNLNPNQIKTWEDLPLRGEKLDIELYDSMCNIAVNRFEINEKIIDKAIATFRIAWLIDLGYGGMVSEEEKSEIPFNSAYYSILPDKDKGFKIVERQWVNYGEFVCFHLHSQAEEFMSHESNRKLVEQYYMM